MMNKTGALIFLQFEFLIHISIEKKNIQQLYNKYAILIINEAHLLVNVAFKFSSIWLFSRMTHTQIMKLQLLILQFE